MRKNRTLKRILWLLSIAFLFMNVIAFFHAYKFTHFAESNIVKTQSPEKLGVLGKIKALLLGVDNPRPVNKSRPLKHYETIVLQSNFKIECWYINNHTADEVKGTVVICHGYSGEKSSMLDKAAVFDSLGYNTFLIDFMGSGGSEGNATTIGYKEAEQVKTAYEFLQNKGVKNIYLFGTSLGAVAVMKSVSDYDLNPEGIIIECPFGSMYETVCARFRNMHAPVFPMAGLLVFWGGVQNGYWAFGHNPAEYARNIKVPTLLLYGEKDVNVSRQEIDDIYNNLQGEKTLKTFKDAGHENYLTRNKEEWKRGILNFFGGNQKNNTIVSS